MAGKDETVEPDCIMQLSRISVNLKTLAQDLDLSCNSASPKSSPYFSNMNIMEPNFHQTAKTSLAGTKNPMILNQFSSVPISKFTDSLSMTGGSSMLPASTTMGPSATQRPPSERVASYFAQQHKKRRRNNHNGRSVAENPVRRSSSN